MEWGRSAPEVAISADCRPLRLGASGVVIGGAVAIASGRWIAPLLFNESPHDPTVFGIVAAVLIAVTLVACMIPAVRATRVDPNWALRSD